MKDFDGRIPVYRAFGLNIRCELTSASLFGMCPVENSTPDVIIRLGKVPEDLEGAEYRDKFISAVPECILLKIKNTARYLICNGKEITIEPEPNVKEGDVAVFAFGSAIGTLLYQRSILALHGSAVRTSKGAVIFSGKKGAGKSTTAAALASRGWEFMSDDVCAVHLEHDKPILYPGLSHAKLALDSYSSILGHVPRKSPVSAVFQKYTVSLNYCHNPSPLYAVCILERTSGCPCMEKIHGAESLSVLTRHIYRPSIHYLIEHPAVRFRQYVQVSSYTKILRIFRSNDYNRMSEFIKLLEDEILT